MSGPGRPFKPQHGLTEEPIHYVWNAMLQRCYNQKTKSYPRYGGRGITVCQDWRDDFKAFFRDMGDRPSPKHTIERIDNDGPYCKANCRWATRYEQNNHKSNNIRATAFGETKTVTQWAIDPRCVVTADNLRCRVKDGWDHVRAITTPPRSQKRRTA